MTQKLSKPLNCWQPLMKVEKHRKKNTRIVAHVLLLWVCILLLNPIQLAAQQSNANNTSPPTATISVAEESKDVSFEQYFTCLNSCSYSSEPIKAGDDADDAFFSCLDACSYPRVTVYQKKHAELIPAARLTQVDKLITEQCFPSVSDASSISLNGNNHKIDKCINAIIAKRLECYSHTTSVIGRRACRKEYSQVIMRAVKGYNRILRETRHFNQKRGHRQLGQFVLCIRECPITRAICRGNIQIGRFVLTEESLDHFRDHGIPEATLTKLDSLTNRRFKDEVMFIQAVTQKIGTLVREFILQYARNQSFQITEKVLSDLADNDLPQEILYQLTLLEGQQFEKEEVFVEAIVKKIGSTAAKQKIENVPHIEIILQYASMPFFQITGDTLDNLKKEKVPETTLEKLESLKSSFETEQKFVAALEQAIGVNAMHQKIWANMELILQYGEEKCDQKENQCLQQCFELYYL